VPERGKEIAQHGEHDCLVVNDQDSLRRGPFVVACTLMITSPQTLITIGGFRRPGVFAGSLGPCKGSSGGQCDSRNSGGTQGNRSGPRSPPS
jgi:hypothetical protein